MMMRIHNLLISSTEGVYNRDRYYCSQVSQQILNGYFNKIAAYNLISLV